MGYLLAFLTLVTWGLADFLVQRQGRKVGSSTSALVVFSFGAILLAPFAFNSVISGEVQLTSSNFLILNITAISNLIGTLLFYRALRVGKLAVVEPITALEIVTTGILAYLILKEAPTPTQIVCLTLIIIGVLLVSMGKDDTKRRKKLESGVLLAIVSVAFNGIVDFFHGAASREFPPLFLNWYTATILVLGVLIVARKSNSKAIIIKVWKDHPIQTFIMALSNNIAWVLYSYSAQLIPIATAFGIAQSFIVLTTILAVVVNKEKLSGAQWLGIATTTIGIVLVSITGNI